MQTRNSPSIHTLHSLARRVHLEGYAQLSKHDLYARLRDGYDYQRLLRAQYRNKRDTEAVAELPPRRSRGRKRDATTAEFELKRPGHNKELPLDKSKDDPCPEPKKLKSYRAYNKLDPIMFTRLGKKKFKFVRPNGTAIWYDIKTLVQYIIQTGEFREPETRIEFSLQDLSRIDAQAMQYGLTLPSVVEARKQTNTYEEKRAAAEASLCLERLCGEVVADMQRCLEQYDPETLEMCLVGQLFPSYSHFFQQIKDRDPEHAKQLVSHHVTFLKGPPNKPTPDPFGFLRIILDFIKGVQKGTRTASEFGF